MKNIAFAALIAGALLFPPTAQAQYYGNNSGGSSGGGGGYSGLIAPASPQGGYGGYYGQAQKPSGPIDFSNPSGITDEQKRQQATNHDLSQSPFASMDPDDPAGGDAYQNMIAEHEKKAEEIRKQQVKALKKQMKKGKKKTRKAGEMQNLLQQYEEQQQAASNVVTKDQLAKLKATLDAEGLAISQQVPLPAGLPEPPPQ